MSSITKSDRNALLARAWEINRKLYPDDDAQEVKSREASALRENYYLALGEYADRLPRVVMSACPFTGKPLKHSFDPWGLDGPWWHQSREFDIEEPAPPPTFKVLLGALALSGRNPVEAKRVVTPGPEAPFVVPRLLNLPGMVAVISQLELESGDKAYPIAYYSPEPIPPQQLHQFWLEQDFWFEMEEEKSGWLIANDKWDFELQPWIKSGKLRWIRPGDPNAKVLDDGNGEGCPYLNLPGDRFPQSIAFGERTLLELPDGSPTNPYED